ncbi:MAG: gliding motility-associated C-terminal domain-containing protein [Chitinophagales bacterium]
MKKTILLLLLFFFVSVSYSQNYTVLGNGVNYSGCNCFKLTDAVDNQGGAAYQNQTINLNNSFDYQFDLFFGCDDAGADGIVFVLTNNITGLGQSGGGLGYGGLAGNSFAVEFDTYQNGGEPANDHIAFESGGSVGHNIAGPVDAMAGGGNIEDCGYHTVRLVWNVNTNTFSVYFDGSLRLSQVFPSFINTYFGGNPIVNWGFSASTGGANNEQRFCVISNSNWTAGTNFQSCNKTVQFNDISTSNIGTVAGWAWNFGEPSSGAANTSTLQNPSHTYTSNGTYTVTLTITDNSGCTNTYSHPVVINAPITLSPTSTSPLCNGGNNGSIVITPSGGFGTSTGYYLPSGYDYTWFDGTKGASHVGLTAGTYTVTATDGVCSATGTYTLNQPTALSAVVSKTDANCGINNGTASITISGGTPPYTGINWGPGHPGASVTGLSPGTFIADFRDANGCSSLLQYTATIGSLPCGVTSSITTTNVSCFGGANGTATLTVTGVSGTANISWSNGMTGASISGLAAGTYTYNYTDALPAHAFSGSITITQPGAAMVADINTVDMSCAGSNNGQALASVFSGGTTPYSYAWSGGQPNSPSVTGLSTGPISVTITDGKGCTATASGNITGPPTLTLSITKVDDSCYQANHGSATAIVGGGNGGYTYDWSNNIPGQTNYNLGAGTYTLTVTDSKGCTITGSTTIAQPASGLSNSITKQDVNCFGNSTGSITTNVSGGTPTYTYTWNPATASGAAPTGLASGTYYLTVSDNKACQKIDSITITQPTAALTVTTSHTNVKCHGGSDGTVTINISGGTPPYTYLGNPIPAGTTTIPSLAAGTYAGNIVDSKSCFVAVSETVTEPGVQSLTLTSTNNLCFGGATATATANFVNATGLVSYNWNPGGVLPPARTGLTSGTYAVTATDANSCTVSGTTTITEPASPIMTITAIDASCFGGNGSATANPSGAGPFTFAWSNSAVGQTITPAAGTYTVTATDLASCQQTATGTINQPTAVAISPSQTDINCFGAATGSVVISVSGGTAAGAYNYTWSPNVSTTSSASSLGAGSYAVTVTDDNSCSATVTVTLAQPASALSYTVSSLDKQCNGGVNDGRIVYATSGGTVPYTFTWSANASSTIDSAINLDAGTYDVTITDAKGCSVTNSVTIAQPALPLSVLSQTQTNVSCFGGNNGSATVVAQGGTIGYSYAWTPNVSSSASASGLSLGNYTVTITDSHGCSVNTSFAITEPAILTATATALATTCNAGSDGSVAVTAGGGTPAASGYVYTWNPNVSSASSASGLIAGTYTITVSDSLACSVTASATVTSPSAVGLAETHTNEPCFGDAKGTVQLSASGGTPAYTLELENGGVYSASPNGFFNGLLAGTYNIRVTDSKGCPTTSSVTITEPSAIAVAAVTDTVKCFGESNGAISASASGGASGYSFAFSNGVTNTTGAISGLPAANYTVTVTDVNGCSTATTISVTQPDAVEITLSPVDSLVLNLGEGQVITASSNYSDAVFNWSPATGLGCTDCNSNEIQVYNSTAYIITASSAPHGKVCSTAVRLPVTVIPNYKLYIPNAFTPNADGINDLYEIFGNKEALKFLDIEIFNRWGEKVYESKDIFFKWDGRYKGDYLEPGVYVYTLNLTFLDNHSESNQRGSITILR